MLKWILFAIIIIFVDILVTVELLSSLEPIAFVVLYLSTTVIGAILLFLRRADFKAARQVNNVLTEAFKERVNGIFNKTTNRDLEDLRPMMLVAIYMLAIIFIAIPGLVTDLVGILLATPFLSNWLVGIQIKRTLAEDVKLQP